MVRTERMRGIKERNTKIRYHFLTTCGKEIIDSITIGNDTENKWNQEKK